MAKYNKKKEPVVPTTVNKMGEKSYTLSAKEELVATTLTTFLQASYYEKEKEIVARIKDKLGKVEPLFAAKLAVYLRNEANMRSVSHLIAGELTSVKADWKTRFYNKVLVRPDDMSEILAYYAHVINKGKTLPIPNALKKAFKQKLESMDAYLIDKYKMKRREFSLIDLVRLVHPKPNGKNAKAFKNLLEGKSLAGLYSSKILEKELSAAGQGQKSKAKVEEAKAEAIEAVLTSDKGMPIMNLLRNLVNIIETAPDMVDEACRQLTIKEKILNSRLLPFRFVAAYNEVSAIKSTKVVSSKKTITFEKDLVNKKSSKSSVEKVLDALSVALQYSVENIPELEGNVAVLVDHSGSVRGDAGGSSLVSAFSKVNSAMIGNLFGSMLAWRQDNVYIGLFGDRLVNVPVDRSKKLLDFNKQSFDLGGKCGSGTENGLYIFLENCIKEKTKVDYLCIFSDMVIGSGGQGGWDRSSNYFSVYGRSFQELFKKFKEVNPQCKTIAVDIRQTDGKSVFDKSLQVLQVSGWSEKIFDTIKSNCVGYKELIKTIEAIEI